MRFLTFLLIFTITININEANEFVRQYYRFIDEDTGIIVLAYKDDGKNYILGEAPDIDSFIALIGKEGKFFKPENIDYQVPFPEPRQKIAVALNYYKHAEESNLNKIVYFPKLTKLTTWNEPVLHFGDGKGLLDYEVEWGFLLSRDIEVSDLDEINEENIDKYIAGVFLILDMTSREMQIRYGKIQDPYRGFAASKGLPTFAPVGQYFISYSDFRTISSDFKMTLKSNGEIRQNGAIDDIKLMPVEIIKTALSNKVIRRTYDMPDGSKVSAHKGKLLKGDIFLTGTPEGMSFIAPTFKTKMRGLLYGMARGRPVSGLKDYIIENQPRHLVPGDKVWAGSKWLGEIEIPIISLD